MTFFLLMAPVTGETSISPMVSVVPVTVTISPGDLVEYTIVVDTLPDGLAGYRLNVTLSDNGTGEVISVGYPSWAVLNNTAGLPGTCVRMSGVDLYRQVEPGASGIILGSFMLRADRTGRASINMQLVQMDADGGNPIIPEIEGAELLVEEPAPEPPGASFSASPRSGYAPLSVQFTDLSTGTPTAWAWDFDNDGTIDSREQDPAFVYHGAGLFGVTLTVTNAGGSDTHYETGYIRVQTAPPVATGTITGWVASGSDYSLSGVPGVRIRVAAAKDDLSIAGRYQEATTDRDGRYMLTGLPSGLVLYATALSPAPYPDLYAERPVQYQVNSGSLVTCMDTTSVPTLPALINGHDTQLNWVLTRRATPGLFFF